MITHRPSVVLVLILMVAFPFVGHAQTTDARADEAAIHDLLQAMEAAVRAQDQNAYLALVDLSDPAFAREHTHWSDEWATEDVVNSFALDIINLDITGDSATGNLMMIWSTADRPALLQIAGFPAQFTRDGDEWRYAGERWIDFETEYFLVRAAPGMEDAAEALIPALPDVYEHVTSSLDAKPSIRSEIKLYATSEALVATTLLSLPPVSGWNEPGEALKLWPEGGVATGTLAHEFTHFLEFDMAGTAQSRMPWWLSEGLAQYLASAYWSPVEQEGYLTPVQDWQRRGELVDWERMSDFDETPVDLWAYVYPQGYAFARFITETVGEDRRNDWIKAMSVEMNIEQASEAVLGQSFAELDREFRDWLAAG